MKNLSCNRRPLIILILLGFSLMPWSALAQMNTWSNPFTGNRFNNPLSSTLDTTILHSMQRRLTQSQLLGTLPSQQRQAPAPQYMPPPQSAPVPQTMPPPGSVAASTPPLKQYPITATDFTSGPRVLPSVYAQTGPQENQAQLLQTFNDFFNVYERELRKNNIAYAIAFLIGSSAMVHTGREIPDSTLEQFTQDINNILAGSPSYQTMPVQKKQELYESSVLIGSMIAGLNEKPETKEDAKTLAKQVLQSIGAIQ